jgi:hypothetical protein
MNVRQFKTALRVGGTLLSIVGVASLDVGFGLNLAQLTPFQKFGIAMVIAGIVAVLASFAIPGPYHHEP